MNKLKNNTEGNVSHEHHVHIFVLLAMALAAFQSQIKKFDTLLKVLLPFFFFPFFFLPDRPTLVFSTLDMGNR